jgi:hypothetical protein
LQQYAEATIEERERLLPGLERAISKVAPGLLETADTRFFNGDYLKDMIDQCMQRVLARPDLSPDRKTNAMEDAAVLRKLFDLAKQWPVPKLAAHTFEMTLRGMFIGMRAGLSPEEVEGLYARFMSDRQRNLGETPKSDKPAVAHAKELARELAEEENRTFSSATIASKIRERWRLKDIACPKDSWLVRLVRRWRRDGDVPRQAHPLRRQAQPRFSHL